MKKFVVFVFLAVLVVAAFAVMPAHAQETTPPVQEPVGFDLAYITSLIQALILATVPVLAGMGVRLLAAKIEAEKHKLSTEQLWALDLFIKTAVYAAEQIKAKDQAIAKLDYVTSLVQAWLDERKIGLSVFEIRARIEAVVKQEFNSANTVKLAG